MHVDIHKHIGTFWSVHIIWSYERLIGKYSCNRKSATFLAALLPTSKFESRVPFQSCGNQLPHPFRDKFPRRVWVWGSGDVKLHTLGVKAWQFARPVQGLELLTFLRTLLKPELCTNAMAGTYKRHAFLEVSVSCSSSPWKVFNTPVPAGA